MGVAAPTERASQWAGDTAVVVITELHAINGFAREDVAQLVVVLGNAGVEHGIVTPKNALLQSHRCADELAVEELGVSETFEWQLLWEVFAIGGAAYNVIGSHWQIIAKHHAGLQAWADVSAFRQRKCHLPHCHERGKAAVIFPFRKVIGVISHLCLSSHASVCEIAIILIVVAQAQMIVEVVLIVIDFHLVMFVP